jgi:hypothetical protein
MRRLKVLVAGASLVDLNDYEAGEQGRDSEEVEDEVGGCAGTLLRGGVCGLKDQGGLGYEEESGGVEQLEGSLLAERRRHYVRVEGLRGARRRK